ncbi:hypothetical protein HYX13_01070 [Candidatus Woesearchaeota archaeon]|nr:hypothetical protein [Candidatus Woesearchaeota archaeon]
MQKRGVIFPSTKAQITIFMILGIIILFVFLFLITLNARVATNSLEESREEIFSKAFRKEALRIFVEDCLRDELRSALRLIGKQGGRIWDDQEGGTEQFASGVGGIFDAHSGDRVAYGLTRKEYLTEEPQRGNPYPCNEPVGEAPVFCKYFYPMPEVRFGVPQPWESNIEKDLENYLKINAQSCIEGYLREKVPGAKLSPEEYTLDVDLRDDGIAVQAFYPLRFGLEGKDYFTLSTFDFLYPSSLRRFLRAVYFQPLYWDWQYVDFAYEDDAERNGMLKDASFTASGITRTTFKTDYDRLGIILEQERVQPTGDTLFTATAPFPHIVDTPGEYVFKFARQNRPPALDYVGRNSCAVGEEQYDYLVVKGANEGLGEIDIKLNAKDPDEEEDGVYVGDEEDLKYLFSGDDISEFQSYLVKEDGSAAGSPTIEGTEARGLVMKKPVGGEDPILRLDNRIYTITAKVQDKWVEKQEDSQEVRILVDNALDPSLAGLSIEYPWGAPLLDASGKIIISEEDPFVIKVKLPEETAAISSVKKITFTGTGTNSFTTEFSDAGESCVDFPNGGNECDLVSSYTDIPFEIPTSSSDFNKIKASTSGTFTADFSVNYCDAAAENIATGSQVIGAVINVCIPYINYNNPYPYIPEKNFHQNMFTGDATTGYTLVMDGALPKLNLEVTSPYQATHFSEFACCNNDGTIKTTSPQNCQGPPNCLDLPNGFTSDQEGYLLVEHIGICTAGNFCDNTVPTLFEDLMICGDPDKNIACLRKSGGTGIDLQCEGQNAWDYHDNIFCGGIETMGCSKECDVSSSNRVYINIPLKDNDGNFISIADYVKSNNGNLPSGFGARCQANCPSNAWYKDTDSENRNDGIFSEACP